MKYKTKPCEIEALEFNGKNHDEIADFCKPNTVKVGGGYTLLIPTLEGEMIAKTGDFIIKGLRGEFYPCKPDVFHKKYESI